MSRILHVLAISLALAPAAQAQTSLQSAGSEMLVPAGQLAGQLHDPALVVLHVADRESAFTEGHIPGARFVRYGDFAVDGDTGVGSELPPIDQLKRVFEAVGVSDTSRVVLYGSSTVAAARAFFTLDAEFRSAGADRRKPVVTYCMVGMRASVAYFVARCLGYDARLYDGSIVDWTKRKLPTKTGR